MESIRNAASHAPGSASCWQRNWPRVFLLMSLAVVVLAFVAIIIGFIKIIFAPNVVLLNIYCMLFGLLGFSAELRQFSPLRRIIYVWMKYFYFLVYYKARGIFYILFGVLLLGNGAIEIVGGVIAVVLGALMLIVGVVVGLPEFEDPAEQKRAQEEFQRYYGGGAAPPPAPVPAASSSVQADTPAVPATAPKSAAPQKPAAANLYREYNFGESGGREGSSTFSSTAPANPYEENTRGTVKPPLQEDGLTRGESELALKKQFAQAVANSADDLR